MTDRKGQCEVYELMTELEQLIMETGLKARIVDSVRELKEELRQQLSEEQWQKLLLRIEETVSYTEKQIFGAETDILTNDMQVISGAEVNNRIWEIWLSANELVKKIQVTYRQEQAYLRQKQEADMTDWTNIAVNYNIMSDPAHFNAECYESGQRYKQQADKIAADYIDECAREYANVMDRLKGLISTISRGQISVTARDIYEKWDRKQELLHQELIKNAGQFDKGESEIAAFGQVHMKSVRRIIRQKKIKRLLYALLPLITILMAVIAVQSISYLKGVINHFTEETFQEEAGFADKVLTQVKDKAVDKISEGIIGNLFGVIKGVLIPIFLITVIAWILWIFYTKKLYQKWVKESLEKYLRPQIEAFRKENRLLKKEDENFHRMEEMVLKSYNKVFQEIFDMRFDTGTEDSPEGRIKELRRKWNSIQCL